MIKKLLLAIFFLLVGIGLGRVVNRQTPSFESLSVGEMQQRIVTQRDLAIQKAVEAGDYRCCISPACTMCFMEPNEWNNFKAGTCACDDLIAQGEKPCPQCERGLCAKTEEGVCKVSGDSGS